MAFIPTKGVNKALKEFGERTANNVANRSVRATVAQNSKSVQRGIQSVEREMAENAARSMPIQDLINKNTGVDVPRKANGRRDMKSAKESANVFNQSSNREIIDANTQYADDVIASAIAEGREALQARNALLNNRAGVNSNNSTGSGNRAQRRIDEMRQRNADRESLQRDWVNAKEAHIRQNINNYITKQKINKNNATGSGNKAQRRIEQMREAKIAAIDDEFLLNSMVEGRERAQTNSALRDARIKERRMRQEAAQDLYHKNQGSGNKAQRRIEEMRRNSPEGIEKQKAAIQKQIAIAQEKKANPRIGAVEVQETSPSGGNASAAKHLADKIKGNNTVYNMAAMGVGGALVLNLANNKGQQSNAQLYGQY